MNESESFQIRYCRHFGVPAERYAETMMRRTLYGHARWLRWLCSSNFLSPDRGFIAGVGKLTRRRDFSAEVMAFRGDARNLSFLRRTMRLRVSCARLNAVFREVWPASAAGHGE